MYVKYASDSYGGGKYNTMCTYPYHLCRNPVLAVKKSACNKQILDTPKESYS